MIFLEKPGPSHEAIIPPIISVLGWGSFSSHIGMFPFTLETDMELFPDNRRHNPHCPWSWAAYGSARVAGALLFQDLAAPGPHAVAGVCPPGCGVRGQVNKAQETVLQCEEAKIRTALLWRGTEATGHTNQ